MKFNVFWKTTGGEKRKLPVQIPACGYNVDVDFFRIIGLLEEEISQAFVRIVLTSICLNVEIDAPFLSEEKLVKAIKKLEGEF